MSQDYTTSSLAAALAAFQADLPGVGKPNRANTGQYGYNYADLNDVSSTVLPLLATHGLCWSAMPTMTDAGRFVLRYELLHISGESRIGEYPLPDSAAPQQMGSAITYARRYTLCAVTGVAPDEDDDGAEAQRNHRPQQRGNGQAETSQPDPATDQLNVAKIEVTRLGAQLGLNLTGLMADYRAWSDGKELKHADLTELSEYLGSLQTRVEAQDAEQAEQGAGDAAA